MIDPLRLSLEVACSVEHAFATWTEHIDSWWPADHTASGEADASVILEPRLGGRLYERTAAGAEHDWGEVTRWDPPSGFSYLWHLRRDRADATDVDIRFTATQTGTRVDIVHSGWERLGSEGQTWRDRNSGGWATLLPHFQELAERNQS